MRSVVASADMRLKGSVQELNCHSLFCPVKKTKTTDDSVNQFHG